MPLWGNRDQYSDAPKFVVSAHTGQKGQQQYGNTVFMADQSEVGANAINHAIASPGWVKRRVGTGPIKSYVINSGGTLYSNSDTLTVSGGTVNATANLVTDANGVITSIVANAVGAGFSNSAASSLTITTSTGSGANVALVFGGRAGRISWETLVCISGPITTDSTSFSNTSTANVANSTGTADDTVLPDA